MEYRSASDVDELNPLLVWGQRFLVVALILLCVLGLLTDRFFPGRTQDMREQTTDILAPMVELSGAPVRWARQQLHSIRAYLQTVDLAAQADDLTRQLDFLQQELERQDQKIAELRANVNLPPEELETFLTARVLFTGNGLFTPSLVLNVGNGDIVHMNSSPHSGLAVRPGLAVVTRRGILGRLQSVGENSSRVRLITNREAALPVVVGEFRVRGTAFGNDTQLLTLVAEEALPGAIRLGDVVMTSSIDPDIPFLFHVGEVVQLSPNIQVQPAAIGPDGVNGFVQIVLKEQLDQVGEVVRP